VFDRVGLFDPTLGVRPGRVVGSEETDLCYRLERAGGRLAYEPAAAVSHPVAAAKLTKAWFRKRAYHAGRTACLVELHHLGRGRLLRRNITRLFRRSSSGAATQSQPERAGLGARLFLARFRLVFAAGYLVQLVRGG
jgi:GT2 family glycosyltransferase